MRSLFALLAVAFATLSACFAIAAVPAADQIEVRGIVLDQSGHPAAGAVVTAVSEPFDQASSAA